MFFKRNHLSIKTAILLPIIILELIVVIAFAAVMYNYYGQDLFAPHAEIIICFLFTISIACIILTYSLIQKRIIKPLGKILDAIHKTAMGDKTKITIEPDGTVKRLSLAINNMFDTHRQWFIQMKEAESALLASQRRFNLFVDATRDGMWDWSNINEDQQYWSDQMRLLLGYSKSEMESTYQAFVQLIHPDDILLFEETLQNHKRGEKDFDIEVRMDVKNLGYKWFATKGKITFEDSQNSYRMVGSISDISERKKVQEEMDRTMKHLVSTNSELERFAYFASHDLREPLRMVIIFNDLLMRNYSDKLDETAIDYLKTSMESSSHMQDLIDDLLSYSSIDEEGEKYISVDMNGVFTRVCNNLSDKIHNCNATVTSDPLPTIKTSYPKMVRLMQNIIGNAIKYHEEGKSPNVHVGFEESERSWLFFVLDDGIGIKKDYLEKIFVPFKRLHSRKSYAGTGIGLAICNKIVDILGGEITVTSKVGRGSTFYIKLPKIY